MTYGEVEHMANVEGLQKTLEFIKEHPDEWGQYRWHTCFAGIAVRVLKGAALDDRGCCNQCSWLTLDGHTLTSSDIAGLAVAALGLTPEQDEELFCGNNTLEDLERIVAEIVAEAMVSA
jgi:hypothetical protein